MNGLRAFLRDGRGASAAEFALVLPLFLLFLLGTVDAGRYIWTVNEAEKATQIGARWAVATQLIPGGDASDGLLAHKSLPMVQDRPAISRSHGAAWNVLISRYIVVMPVSGEACGTQNTSGGPPDSALHSAISAKVGAAASPSQPATPGAEPLPAEAPAL